MNLLENLKIKYGGIISKSQRLNEDFIREFKDKVDWDYISTYQYLSENFIEEFKDYVNWNDIIIYQILSEKSIIKFRSYFEYYISNDYDLLSLDTDEFDRNTNYWQIIFYNQKTLFSKNFILKKLSYNKLEHIKRYFIYKIKDLPFDICKIIDSFN